ncbi:MAG: mycofactocin biosynthesis FMN-dependent deaminase MftD [Desulfuromonadaceae bacterium]
MGKTIWFETVAEAERLTEKRLPRAVFKAIRAGSEKGVTYKDNTEAFAELGAAPHIADLPGTREQATTIMGQEISQPVFISPAGVQAVNPDGELSAAKAAAARGTAMSLSQFASKSIEEICAACPKTFFQAYWSGGREIMKYRLERARAAGAVGMILTLDWCYAVGRDWGSPKIPEKMDLKTMIGFAPQAVLKPRWCWDFAKAFYIPDLKSPNFIQGPGGEAPTFFQAYGEWMMTPPPTWEDVAWIIKEWGGPFMLKGITRIDDAKRAVDAGVTAISVSNHGGNNLDTTPAPVRFLADIAEAVGKDVEVVLDGGIRRGSDVGKCLCLGAKAVMIGRGYLWGLAANGQTGVENVLDLMRKGLDSFMLATGNAHINDLGEKDLIIPEGFKRKVGG